MQMMIEGTYGTGKTLLATHIAKEVDKLGIPIYSNYPLKLNNYHELVLSELPNLPGPLLAILDEAYVYLESRTSGRDINRYMSYILMQSRKRQIDFLLTFQLNSMIDLRWTNLCDFGVQSFRDNQAEAFVYDVTMQNGLPVGSFELPFDYAERELFGLYDTFEVIDAPKDISQELTLVDPKDTERAVQRIIEELEQELPLEEWTKTMIDDVIFSKRMPNTYSSRVYSRVQRIVKSKKLRGEIVELVGKSKPKPKPKKEIKSRTKNKQKD